MITIESSVEIASAAGTGMRLQIGGTGPDTVLKHPTLLLGFLMSVVEHVDWTENGRLNLTFSGHHKLSIFDDSSHFESYVIHHDGKVFVI